MSKLSFGSSLWAPSAVETAPNQFEKISLLASSSSSPIFSFIVGFSSPSMISFIAVMRSGVAIKSSLPPPELTLAVITGGFMPLCAFASNSFGSPTAAPCPVSPSAVLANSALKMPKRLFIIIVFISIIVIYAIIIRLNFCLAVFFVLF